MNYVRESDRRTHPARNAGQMKIAEKAKDSPAAVSLIVAGKSKSKRIEDLIRTEVKKALAEEQEA